LTYPFNQRKLSSQHPKQGCQHEKDAISISLRLIFSFSILLHKYKLLIGSLQIPISATFGLNDLQWGLVNTGALIVGTVFYPLWGYLYDRFARAKLLALASFIWGATTWISLLYTYPVFITRSY
jgi:MFS family permease